MDTHTHIHTLTRAHAHAHTHCSEDVVMEDLDQYLQTELDSINDMFQEFQTQDKQSERRIQSESQDLKVMESKAKEVGWIGMNWFLNHFLASYITSYLGKFFEA